MPDIGTDAIVSAAWDGRLDGQQILLTHHYAITSITPGPTVDMSSLMTNLANGFDVLGEMSNVYPSVLSQDVTDIHIQLQVVHPIRYTYRRFSITNPAGLLPVASMPPNCAHAIVLTNDESGPRNRSVKHIGGTPTDGTQNGQITPAFLPILQALADTLVSGITVTAGGQDVRLEPVCWHRAAPSLGQLLKYSRVMPTTRVMRRRTVGLGS